MKVYKFDVMEIKAKNNFGKNIIWNVFIFCFYVEIKLCNTLVGIGIGNWGLGPRIILID